MIAAVKLAIRSVSCYHSVCVVTPTIHSLKQTSSVQHIISWSQHAVRYIFKLTEP